jgi:Fe-S-cluster containining protein
MNETLRQFISAPALPDRATHLRGEDLCALCAGEGLSCCRTDPAAADLSFPLSEPEWRRLRPYSALASDLPPDCADEAIQQLAEACLPHEGRLPPPEKRTPREGDATCEAEENSPGFFQALLRLFPGEKAILEQRFPPGGRHFRLRLRADGSCVFQGRAGCRLPREVRPWYCRLFPAWVQGRAATLFRSETCLISRRAASPAHGLELLNTTALETRRLYDALRGDWSLIP